MSRDLGLTRSEISTVYSLGTLAAALFLPRVGGLIDVHGVRRVTLLVAWAFGLTAIALAFAQGLVWLAVGFFGNRLLGQGALSLAARTIVVFRFRARLGSAIGLSGALAAIPMSLMPVLLASLIVDVGWRVTWVVGGLSVWLVVVPMAIWFLKPGHDRPLSTKNDHEQDLLTSWTRAQAVRTPMFWVVTLVTASVAMITTGLAFHQISILGQAGLSPTLAAANFVPQTVASVTAIAVVAPLSDRVAPRFLLAGSMLCLASGLGLLLVLERPFAPVAYALSLGGAMGSSQALDGTLHPRFFGMHAIAAIRGTAFMVAVVGTALGPVLVALINQATGSFDAVAPLLSWIPLTIAAAALLVRTPDRRAGGLAQPQVR